MKPDLEALEEDKRRNFEERLKFIDLYVDWLKRTPNEVWSRQQRELIGGKGRGKKKRQADG